jgi:hypothetical protein
MFEHTPFYIINNNDMKNYVKSLSELANHLQVPYTQLYKHRHRPEFIKSERGYNVEKIVNYL